MVHTDGKYDYVIVGAGSAGCVLAARLTEDPAVRVVLVEAGPPDTAQEIHIPVALASLFKSRWDWDYDSEPEPALGERRNYLPRGRTLGGSSSLNVMIYMRGNRVDFDDWAAGGAKGWSYEEVLPYFRRAEDNERGADRYHGAGGPLTVSDGRSLNPLGDAFLEAAEQAGFRRNADFNGESQLGVGRFQLTQRDGLRCSTADAYLRPALERPNLDVVIEALAHRVVFEGDRAVGVEISEGSALRQLRADREVILSAGSYGSPHLLLRTGIGPSEVLSPFQIRVRHELPVGQQLQDHPFVALNYLTAEETLLTALSPANLALLQNEHRGPLTSNVGEAGGFMHTRPGLPAPDLQFYQAPALFYQEALGPLVADGFAIGPCVVKPTSRGSLTLRTADPDTAPRITNNFLTTVEDREAMIAGVRIALDIAAQPALKSVITKPFTAPDSSSDADVLAYIRRTAQTLYHPTSTCAIGEVVDSQLQVLGLQRLRVVDASVMPSVTRGNTNAATIMIAEKAADLIRDGGH